MAFMAKVATCCKRKRGDLRELELMARKASTADIVDRLGGVKVVVVGDVMLDRFVDGTVDRISPEAPIPVFSVTHEMVMLGASGNVLRNLAVLGGEVFLSATVGDDAAGSEIRDLVTEEGQTADGLRVVPGRRTAIKTRYIAGGQQMMRADRETIEVADNIADTIADAVAREVQMRVSLLSDYGGRADGAH